MSRGWFVRKGWLAVPCSWQGTLVALPAVAFCAQVFWAVDRNSHSVSDTLYGIFPFWACAFLLYDWVAGRSTREGSGRRER